MGSENDQKGSSITRRSDPRRVFMLNLIDSYFGCDSGQANLILESNELTDFLDDSSTNTLSVRKSNIGDIILDRKIIFENGDFYGLMFYKLSPAPIQWDTIRKSIHFINFVENPLAIMHSSLTHIYKPSILNSNSWNRLLDAKIQKGISQLDSGLEVMLFREKKELTKIQGIHRLEDELRVWTEAGNMPKAGEGDGQNAVDQVAGVLRDISRELSQFSEMSLTSGKELFEGLILYLQDMWKLGEKFYTEHRLLHLLELIGSEVVHIVQLKLKDLGIFSDSFNKIERHLSWGISLCTSMNEMSKKLTTIMWPTFDPSWRKYAGGEYIPQISGKYTRRLEELLRIRSIHRQLLTLVPVTECPSLAPKKCFAPLKFVNVLYCSSYIDQAFENAVLQFESNLVPAESRIASKLRQKLSTEVPSNQLLLEYKRYKELVQRPKIAADLTSQREHLLGVLTNLIEQYSEMFEKREFREVVTDREYSQPICEIYNTRHTINKIKDVQLLGRSVLFNLSDYQKLDEQADVLSNEMKEYEKEVFDEWTTTVDDSLLEKGILIDDNSPVVKFDPDSQLMEVNFSNKLQRLADDVGQLSMLGYKIPKNINHIVELAKLHMNQARELDGIANFHNTIGERMIKCQQPIMLPLAKQISKLVNAQEDVNWRNIDKVSKYIAEFQILVHQLSRLNNKLRVLHEKIRLKVIQLFDVELISGIEKWKQTIRDVRDIFQDAEAQGSENLLAWKTHWDRQIYKIFEISYVKELQSLETKLPPIPVELVYRDQMLQFKPPKEECRAKYYSFIRRFVTLPLRFTGVNTDTTDNVFRGVYYGNNTRVQKVYVTSEEILNKLFALEQRFAEWVAIGNLELDELCANHLKTAEDWDMNFRETKNKAQEISRLQFQEEQIGPFRVHFSVLRLDIELLVRKFIEELTQHLQNHIAREVVECGEILAEAIKSLKIRPQSVKDIANAKVIKDLLVKKSPQLREIVVSIEAKNRVLQIWSRERADLNKINILWENFSALLENYEQDISKQVESVKVTLGSNTKQLHTEMENFKIRWEQLKPKGSIIGEDENKFMGYAKFVNDSKEEWEHLVQKKVDFVQACNQLDVECPDFTNVEDIGIDLSGYSEIWIKLQEFYQGLKEYLDQDWIIFRTKAYTFESFLTTWDRNFEKDLDTKNELIIDILKLIQSYKEFTVNVKLIRGDVFTERHWYELFQFLEMKPKALGNLKVSDFIKVRDSIRPKQVELKELNARAFGELTVRQALSELDAWEVESRFNLSEVKDSQNNSVVIIEDFKSILNKVGDNGSLLQSVKSSPYYGFFADRINTWESRLVDIDSYLQSLNKIQRRWVYLEPIFGHGVLEAEQSRFRKIDKDFRKIMQDLNKENKVCNICKIPGVRLMLSNMLEQLSKCQSSLNEFLETKRSGFPRFYFLGDDDLLEILGQSTKPNVIQSHLKKLFAGIHNVEFDKDSKFIIAMKSLEGEYVSLKTKVKITTSVEEWLGELSNEMKDSLKSYTLECISDSKNERQNPDLYPSQILSLCNSITFTDRCEDAIRANNLPSLLAQLKEELDSYTNVQIPKDHPNPAVLELKLKDLVLDLIHQTAVVEHLIRETVKNVNDWQWQKQLRFYVQEDGMACIKMADAEFVYSYEYQGNAPKLVHTPLTDKCYLTLTQGMRMGLGGNPYGPAGTGKTESVKALGGLMGRQVLVFNCDEGIDVKSMGRIFIGLVKCGAWGCFDEFNRLEGATLSAVSMQIQPIQTALKTGAKTVIIQEETVPLDPNAGIFVTMNPAGKGYGGRNKLPDNLKQLFRPVVMSSPNNDLIAEVILYTEGFKFAKVIGHKLVQIFDLSNKLLTPQTHYDWGLRALKTVLKGCGTTLKDHKQKIGTENKGSISENEESNIVVAALRINTLPKLTPMDLIRFESLIKDLFPFVTFKKMGYEELAECVRASFPELKLEANEIQVRKCLEVYEQLQQRMGVVVVGPPCCGKTTVLNLLQHALTRMKMTVKTHTINPKAMPKSLLLGHINLDTRGWTDGVLTLKAQQVYSEPPNVISWIICDGDIDPEWIESLNSVLDDNRLLTLPSGWRIKFGPNVNFIFETHDLKYASPATISRMGMILMSEEDIDAKRIINAWLTNQPEETRDTTFQLFEDYFYKALDWIRRPENILIHTLPIISIVKNGLSQLRNVASPAHMAIGLIRGLGAHLSSESKNAFAKEVIEWLNVPVPDDDVLSLTYNKDNDSLEPAPNQQSIDFDESAGLGTTPLVKTSNVQQILSHIEPWLEIPESFLLVGAEGSGKAILLDYAFRQLRNVEVCTIHCSSLISSQHLLQKLSQICVTKSSGSGREYRSKSGGRLILYFKDINLVKPDKWGTCQLIEFLQQLITHNGFYDNNLEWVGLYDVQIVASITVSFSSGRYSLSPRFLASVRLCTVTLPSKEQLFTIYQNYFTYYFHKFHSDMTLKQNFSSQIATAIIQVIDVLSRTYTKNKASHYQFTARELTNWVLGIMRYQMNFDEQKVHPETELIQIWANEASRLFRDKFVSKEDKEKFDSVIITIADQIWNTQDIFPKNTYYISNYAKAAGMKPKEMPLSPAQVETGDLLWKESAQFFEIVVEKGLIHFSREFRELNIVIYKEVLENVANLDRILSAPGSSLVLVGRAGIGRKTALNIVSSLHGATIFTLKLGKGYGIRQFKMDLKAVIQMSAVEGQKVFFLVEDFQLIDQQFLDIINGILSSGEVPGLYSPEELETVISPLRDSAAAEGFPFGLMAYFAKRIRELLHIILIMDYTNENFQLNCESNPAIYKQCSFLWMDSWSEDSLFRLPRLICEKFYPPSETHELSLRPASARSDDEFVQNFRKIYMSLSSHLSSPRRYIAFIHTYAYLYTRRSDEINDQMKQLKAGIRKLDEARSVVETLKTDAASQELVLAEKQNEATMALNQITLTMRNANVQREEMELLRKNTLAKNDVLLAKKSSIDAELRTIEPVVQAAQASVGNIKNEALTEIRSLRAPPDTIRDILEGVLRLMGIQDMSWHSMKTFLTQRGVKDEIRNFDARTIKSENRKSVETLLKKKGESFEEKNAKRASAAAAPLAAWVVANVKYSQVLEKVEPLEREQAQLKRNLQMAEDQIQHLSDDLTTVDQRVEELKLKLNQNTKEAAEVELKLDQAKKTILAAEGLVGKLYHEFSRWSEQLKELGKELMELPMKIILAAAFMTYLSDATESERIRYVEAWLKLLGQERFDFRDSMSTEQELLSFQAMGLPTDKLSQENAIIITQTSLRPFLIDPSSRGTEWLRKILETERQVVSISLRDPKLTNEIELAVRFGKTLIINEADEIEPILIPLLRADFIVQGSREMIQIADRLVDYNHDFRLFLTTRNPNPIFPPDSAAVVTIVNFTTTRAGLSTQLLTAILASEKPELNLKKVELLKRTDILKSELNKLGALLLNELANAKGNILENQELLSSLQQTKEKSIDIQDSLEKTIQIEDALNNEINVYLPLAEFGSQMFYAILDLPKLNRLYKFSLSCFINLFNRTLELRTEEASNTDNRIEFLKTELEFKVYEYVCRSLFKVDRLAFSLHLSHLMHQDQFRANEWNAFTGQLQNDPSYKKALSGDMPEWIPEERHSSVSLLSIAFPATYSKLQLSNKEIWSRFQKSSDCEADFPSNIKNKLTPFQMLLVIQTLRPETLQTGMINFAASVLDRKSLFPPPVNFREIYKDTYSEEPILLLVGLGADPSTELKELARTFVGEGAYTEISMGQEEFSGVLQTIYQAAEKGHWVCLKNIHLVIHWLQTLEKEIRNLNPHEKFRLWLTAEPHNEFPTLLAESCLKVAYESPQGMKKNLQRSYSNWAKDYVVGDRNVLRMQALFALAYFHAIVQERRTYIPQGWTKFYEFNESDLRAGAEVLDLVFKSARGKNVQWQYTQGVFENAIYGGRVDNIYDNRILVSYLKQFFNEHVLGGTTQSKKEFAPGIKLPVNPQIKEFLTLIDKMPDYDKPILFGLPSNIERSWQRTVSGQVLEQLKVLDRILITEESQFDRISWANEMNPILNLWRKVNQEFGTTNLLSKKSLPEFKLDDNMDPLCDFVKLEHMNIITFLHNIHRSLGAVNKVVKGQMTPNAELTSLFTSLVKHQTPEEWIKYWDGPTDPLSFLRCVVQKTVFIQKWVQRAEQGNLLKDTVNLSELLNPESFLCAFKQYCARKQSVPMDQLKFVCLWNHDSGSDSARKTTCTLTGLHLEGCSFDGDKLYENEPDSPSFCKVPDCSISWIPITEVSKFRKGETISVPLYFNESRQSLIGCLEFPISGNSVKWIQTGIGLFLKSD